MEGIMKDCLPLYYERSMQEKIHITSQAIHSDSPQLLVGSLLHL